MYLIIFTIPVVVVVVHCKTNFFICVNKVNVLPLTLRTMAKKICSTRAKQGKSQYDNQNKTGVIIIIIVCLCVLQGSYYITSPTLDIFIRYLVFKNKMINSILFLHVRYSYNLSLYYIINVSEFTLMKQESILEIYFVNVNQ